MIKIQGMTPIAKIENAIVIPIFVKNWDRDPDRHLKKDRDRDRSFTIADLLGDLILFWNLMK